MDRLEYEGKTYLRSGRLWTDMQHMAVNETLQQALNYAYLETIDLTRLTLEELIAQGDKCKESGSNGLAIRFYEAAAKEADERTLSSILPRFTSCYRKQGLPQKAIDLLHFAKEKFGSSIISSVLLTSAAAAYCDLKEYENARICCNRAYAMLGGHASGELSAVFGRIRKESE